MFAAPFGLGVAQGSGHRIDEIFQLDGQGQVAGAVILPVARIVVDRVIIDLFPAGLQCYAVPFRVGWHLVVGGTAGDELDRRIVPFHHLGRLARLARVFVHLQVADLPRAIHLIANAPIFDIIRVTVTVAGAQIGIVGAGGGVAILDQIRGGLNRAGAHVDGQHRRAVDRLAEVHKLIGAEMVGLNRLPGQVATAGPLLLGANPIEPIIAAEKVAARIAHDRVLLFT